MSARILVQHGEQYRTLSVFNEILTTIAQSTDVTPEFLMFKHLSITFENNITTYVSNVSSLTYITYSVTCIKQWPMGQACVVS